MAIAINKINIWIDLSMHDAIDSWENPLYNRVERTGNLANDCVRLSFLPGCLPSKVGRRRKLGVTGGEKL